MAKFFSKRRLKIAEQIIIVIFFAVLIPMTVSGIIINNINQQSNRAQLRDAAIMIANIVSEEIDVFEHSINNELAQIISTIEFFNASHMEEDFLNSISKKQSFYKELTLVYPSQIQKFDKYKDHDAYIVVKRPVADGRFLIAVLDAASLKANLFKTISGDKRQIYVISNETNEVVSSSNFSQSDY